VKLHELREKRTALAAEMRGIHDKAAAESRDYNDTEDKRHKELKVEIAGLDRQIDRAADLAEAERMAPAILHHGRGDGQFEERARQFSVTRAIGIAIGDEANDGLEREISAETERRIGRKARGGIIVPDEVFEVRAFGDNVMTVGTSQSPGAAFPLYPAVHRGDLFISRLRSAIVVGRLGATVLDGLVGDQSIPRQTGSASVQWLAEDGNITDSDLAFDDVELKPKTIASITSYSRKTLANASPGIEQIVRNDLAAIIANAVDRAALLADGTSNQPIGVVEQDGVHEIDLSGGATWEKVLEFIASIQHADAEIGGMGWALNAHAVKKLRSTTRVTNDGSAGFLMESPTAMAGYPAAVTSALPGLPDDGGSPSSAVPATIIFGAFSQLLVGRWGGVEILPNALAESAYTRGRVLMRVMSDVDVAVRHPESFAFADDLSVDATEGGGD
jgi:HK97 family phage major capsid protein